MRAACARARAPRPTALAAACAALLAAAAAVGSAAGQERASAGAAPAWIGVAIHCEACRVERADTLTAWRFSDHPVVVHVYDGGPAQAAGVRVGDRLLRIDGVDLTTREGGLRFGALRVGRPIALTVRREGRELELRVVPGPWPAGVAIQEERFGRELARMLPGQIPDDSVWQHLRAHLDSLRPRLAEIRRLADSIHGLQMRAALERERAEAVRLRAEAEARRAEDLRAQAEDLRLYEESVRSYSDAIRLYEESLRSYGDSLRAWLDSLAVHARVLPPAPGRPLYMSDRGRFGYGDSLGVPLEPDAVAGAQMAPLTPALAEYFPGAERGVLVLHVVEGTPAAAAGLRPGDVIVAAAGRPVRDLADVRRAFREGGAALAFVVVRKGKTVRLEARRP